MIKKTNLKSAFGAVLMGMTFVFVCWFYNWTVASSGGFNPPGDEDYYNFQVRGWRQGHLHMSKEPAPAVLALRDPYDPAQNRDVRLADASYFKGHYYLYFGAAPAAMLMLPYDMVTGRELGTTTAIYVYSVAGFLASSVFWLLLRRRYFPSSSVWIGVSGVSVLGLATHILALERRPLVWELPISMGYAFSMFALLGIYASIHGKRPALAMGGAGFCLGVAVAARPIYLLGSVMFIPPLWHMATQPAVRRQASKCVFAVASGLGVWLIAVCAHNFARFGSVLEFGQNYQLSGVYESRVQHFSLSYIPHNIFLYYFHPGNWFWKFPFVAVTPVANGPPGYLGNWSEAICGLAVTFPFIWFTLALPFAWTTTEEGRDALRPLIGSVASLYASMSLSILTYFVATERYMADFTPSLGLLALLGLLGLEEHTRRRGWNRTAIPLFALACLITATAAILVSFDYHGGALRTLSPKDWSMMQSFFSRFGM